MSNPTKSNGVVVKVSVITDGDAKVHVQCDELKDCQDMRITEGDLKNCQPTGLTDGFDILKSSKAISVMISTLLAVVITVGIKVAFPEVDPQMIGGMSMIGFSASLLVQQWFHSRSFTLTTLLAVVIIVGMKNAYPEVDLLMIGGMSMIGFCVSLFVQQWFKPQWLSVLEFPNQEINCPVTEEPGTESTASTPIKLMEIKTKNGETTIYNCKSETLEEAEELAANQYEQEMALKKADWTHCYPITIREIKRSHASQIILEEKPVCPGDEGPTLVCTEEKPVCPMDENITEEEINSCPGEIVGTESTTPSTPIKLIEVKKNNGEKILYKCKTETLEEAEELAAKQCEEEMTLKKTDCYPIEIREVKKKQDLKIILKGNPVCPMEEEAIIVCEEKEKRFNPLKKSHKIIERRSEQQIAEYGPPEEQNPTFKIVEEPICPRDENSTYEEVTPIKIREYKRSHASQIILERKPVCPGDEEPTLVFTEEKPVCPGDEEPTLVCTEEKSVCPGDEEPTLVCTEEKPVCPEDEKITSPVILKEVTTNKGEVTIYKRKQKKRWSPFKKSHKIIERRSQQQIAEYGPSEEQNPTCNVAEPTKVCEEVAEPTKVCEEVAEPTKVCEEVTEPIKVCEDLPGTKNQLKIALHAKSFIFSILLALIIFVGVKVAFPEVDLQMIGGMSMIGFLVSLLVHQWFISNNSECCHCHVLSGEECTCHTLFGIYFGLLI